MRLGIDAREIQEGVYTGIGRPLVNFLYHFAESHHEDSCILFSSRKILIDFGPRVHNVVLRENITFIWDQWQLPQALKREKVDIFYSPYYKIPLLKPCKTVSAMLDVMYISYAPYYQQMSLLVKLYYGTFGRFYAHRADKILTCSQYSQKDIERIYGVDEAKIKIIPLSVGPIYFVRQEPSLTAAINKKFNISGRYIFYMGNFKAHKNIARLIDAFALIASEFPDVNLVLAGPLEHTYQALIKSIQQHRLTGRVIFTGKIMESDGPQHLYQGAQVFVMPSLYEGFGIPPLEAMACGVPVIASNATSIPEIVGDAGILVDPGSVPEMADAIRKILGDPVLKQELIHKGFKRARDFDTAKVAQEMYDFFKMMEGPFDGDDQKT